MATCRAAGSLAASDPPLHGGELGPPPPWSSLESATLLGAAGPPQSFSEADAPGTLGKQE